MLLKHDMTVDCSGPFRITGNQVTNIPLPRVPFFPCSRIHFSALLWFLRVIRVSIPCLLIGEHFSYDAAVILRRKGDARVETGRVLDAMQRQSVFRYFSYINLDCAVNHPQQKKKTNPMALQFHPDRPFSICEAKYKTLCCNTLQEWNVEQEHARQTDERSFGNVCGCLCLSKAQK